MYALQLENLLLTRLLREHGGSKRNWRSALGSVRLYDVATHPHCNWSVAPSGTIRENRAIEELCDEVRGEYPIVSG